MKICSRQGKFKLMSVNHRARSEGIIGISFLFSNEGMLCVLIRIPHQGDSNEYTQYTIFNKKISLNYPKSAAMRFFIGTQERVGDISVRAIEVLLHKEIMTRCT